MSRDKSIKVVVACIGVATISYAGWWYFGLPSRNSTIAACEFASYSALAATPEDPGKGTNVAPNPAYFDKFADIFKACMESRGFVLDEVGISNEVLELSKVDEKYSHITDSSNFPFNSYTAIRVPEYWHRRLY